MRRLRSLKLINKTIFLMSLLLTVFFLTCLPVLAEQEGDFTYTISNGEATVTGYTGSSGDINIPNTLGGVSVTRIGDMAFQRTTSWPNTAYDIKSIHIPESVKSIGSYAFDCNMGLTSLNLPQGLATIGNNAFQNLRSITTITIPEGVTKIENGTFYNCFGLSTVNLPEGIVSIGNEAFVRCYSLTSINLPGRLSTIGINVFSECSSLTNIMIPSSNSSFASSNGALYSKDGLTLVVWPWGLKDIKIPQGVTTIGDGVFYYRTDLTDFTVPEGITKIGNNAFQSCFNLTDINLPGSVTSIGEYAFSYCRGLKNVTLPEKAITIEKDAFSYCTGLTNINLQEGMTRINDNMFSSCSSLTNIRIPESVTNIGSGSFSGCTGLSSVNIPQGVTSIGMYAFAACTGLMDLNLPQGMTNIGSSAFIGCSRLTAINIPQGVTSIESGVFQRTGLLAINIPQDVTSIGESAFQGCTGLTSVNIPEKVMLINQRAFCDCTNLKSIRINSSTTQISGVWSNWWDKTIPYQTTIIGYDSSYAHNYARSEGNRFVVIGSEEDDATMGAIPQGVMVIAVKDRDTKQPLTGATVSINGASITTDGSGFAMIDVTEGMTSLLSMTCSGYCDYQTNLKFIGGTAEIYYLRKDTDPNSPHVSMINLDDGNAIVDVQRDEKDYFQIANDANITDNDQALVEMKANWKGKTPKRYLLKQDGKTIMESTNGIFEKKALGQLFKPGYEIYAIVEASDGTVSMAVETNIVIRTSSLLMPSEHEDFELRVGNKLGLTIPSEVPIIGGWKTDLEIKAIPVSVSYSEGIYKIGLGLGYSQMKSLLETEKNWSAYKKIIKEMKNSKKAMKDLKSLVSTSKTGTSFLPGLEPVADINGYVEGTIVDGKFVVSDGSLVFKLGATYSRQFQIPVSLPVVLQMGGGVEAEIMSDIATLVLESGHVNPVEEFKLTPSVELGGGVGVANTASVVAIGKLEIPWLTRYTDSYQKVSVDGSVRVTAKAMMFEYNIIESPKFYKVLWEDYYGNRLSSMESLEAADPIAYNIYDSSQYSLMSRDNSANPTEWSGGGGISTASTDYTNQTLKVLQTNIYSSAQPKIITAGDRQVMVWLADSLGRTATNRTMLVYSVYDKTTGIWSAPAAVADDGTADFYPQIGCDGTSLYIAWQNSKTTFADDVTLVDMAKAGEIAVAKFDAATATFTDTTTLTANDSLDTQPQIAVSGDRVGVTWSGNDQNDLFGSTGRNSLYTAQLNGGSWSDSQAILTDQNAIPSLSAGYVNNTLTAAYTLDGDNNLNTIADRELYILGVGQSANRLTNDEVLDSNPVFAQFNGMDTLFWYHDGNIDFVPTASLNAVPRNIFDQKKEGFSDAFSIVNNAAGKTAAIWTQTEDEVTEIYGSLYDNGVWSNDIRISDVGSRIMFPSGIFDNDGNFNIAFNRMTVSEGSPEQSDLCTLKVVPSYNLTISEPYYKDVDIIPNTALPVEIEVANNGALAVDQIKVEVMDGTTTNNTQSLSESIQPGETKTITTQVNLPETITKKDYIIKVTPATGDEYDLSDNQKTITLGYTDLALSLQKYNLGEAGGIVIKAQLENLSYVPTDATLKITEDTLDGKVIFTKTLTDVKQGANQFVTFDLDPQTLAFTSDIKQIYVTVTASGEETSTGDNSDFIVLDNPANIAATLDSIAITTPATKLVYRIGEQLDLSDLVVTGTYSDGTIKAETVTADNITGFDNSKAAKDQVLTITIKGKTATYTVQIGDSSERQLGDVDGNGSITAYDALIALQIATNKKSGSEAEIAAADVGKNGTVEAYDALKILQYATGKITAF